MFKFLKRKKNPKMLVPDKKKFLRQTKPWTVARFGEKKQFSVPKDKKLLKKLGISKKDKILVFAGCYGDWAGELAKQVFVRYTDASRQMLEFAKKHHKINTASQRDAVISPSRPNKYDWSFSFEPFPMLDKGLPLSLLHSLLNRKGAKIVFVQLRLKLTGHTAKLKQIFNALAEIYGANHEITTSIIKCYRGEQKHDIFTLKTNAEARKKALLDLKSLRLLNKHKKISLSEIAVKLKTSESNVKKAVDRLEKISKLFPGRLLKKTRIESQQ